MEHFKQINRQWSCSLGEIHVTTKMDSYGGVEESGVIDLVVWGKEEKSCIQCLDFIARSRDGAPALSLSRARHVQLVAPAPVRQEASPGGLGKVRHHGEVARHGHAAAEEEVGRWATARRRGRCRAPATAHT
jgi:hypothetical protein